MAEWVNIGRTGSFGNPFVIGRDGTREEVVAKHRIWFLAPEQAALRERAKRELIGKAWWCPGCKGTRPCHGQVIAEVVNGSDILSAMPYKTEGGSTDSC